LISEDLRDFVTYKSADFQSEITILDGNDCDHEDYPILSVIIPTLDAFRDGYFPTLIEQLKDQTFQNFETIIVKGDPRQGRAINTGADLARGRYILTLDDDTRIGHRDLFGVLVKTLDEYPDIGMAGVPNLIPEDAGYFIRKAMEQIPRRSSPMVESITESDMAEHPCLIMRKSVFYSVGGENELMPRGLDPYLRHKFRKAGYKVVVVPGVWIHHLPPNRLKSLIKQFFRNGKASAYCYKFYPQWVYDLTTSHENPARERIEMSIRIKRQIINLIQAFFELRFIYLVAQISYLIGFVSGYLVLKKED